MANAMFSKWPDVIEQDTLEAASKIIKRFEGFSSRPYQDPAGVWTIGYGFTHLDTADGSLKVDKNTPDIGEDRATAQLARQITVLSSRIKNLVTADVTSGMQEALLSFVYNEGVGRFTTSTLLKKLNARDYMGAADEFLKWDIAGGRHLRGLEERRKEERHIFLSTYDPARITSRKTENLS